MVQPGSRTNSVLGSIGTMEGYYDAHPLLTLEKPLAIAGLVTDDTRLVGSRFAALTGLPFFDVDRTIEHHAGQSIWELILSEGEAHYRREERVHLLKALASTPCGVIGLGDGALMNDRNLRAVLAKGTLIALELDLPSCYWRIRSKSSPNQHRWHPVYPEPLQSFAQLKPFFRDRQAALQRAHIRIDMRGRHPMYAVDRLMGDLAETRPPPRRGSTGGQAQPA